MSSFKWATALTIVLIAMVFSSSDAYSITGRVTLLSPSNDVPPFVFSAFRVQLADRNGAVLRSEPLDAVGVYDMAIDGKDTLGSGSEMTVRLHVANPRALAGQYAAELSKASEASLKFAADQEAYQVPLLTASLRALPATLASSSASDSSAASGSPLSALLMGCALAALVLFRDTIVTVVETLGSSARRPRKQVVVASR
jgi:hypothetical protein